MSLPPGFLDDLRTRVPLSQVVGRAVTWDMKKSNMARGDWWAACPFHQERSASFHVDDRKGFYYCFGCHAKGDVLTFLKENGNMGFIEAVEALAREAGVAMPARDPQAAARADRRTQLAEVVEAAVQVYRLQLRTGGAAAAREYLAKRRLGEATQARWDLGFAPDARQFLIGALGAKGIPVQMVEAAGLAAKADDGTYYDRFRGRIIFPIRDARGKAVSLAGRAMDPNARAKYLNGPETELFDKGRTLFNLGPARDAAGKGAVLIVAEGYMDVIALVDAGFGATVAPMGTAVTEDQLRLMWRVHPEPVVALDGDTAGVRAAMRVIDLALPMLEAGQGLRFAILPGGQDPDDLIRGQGTAAMQAVLDGALPMARLLWRRETEGQPLDSPERMAALRKRLREAVGRIRDPDIKRYYAEAFQQWEGERRPARPAPQPWQPGRKGSGARPSAPDLGPLAQTKASLLARGDTSRVVEFMCETAILAVLLRYPRLAAQFEGGLDRLQLVGDGHADVLQALLHGSGDVPETRVRAAVGDARVDKLLSHPHIRVLPPIAQPGADQLAFDTLAEQLARLAAERALRKEIAEAEDDMDGLVDEGLTWRLAQAAEARAEASRIAPDAAPGEAEAQALSGTLDALIRNEIWVKRRP